MNGTSIPKKYFVIGGIVLAVIILVVWPLMSLSSTKSAGVNKETALSAQYQANQVYLSSYIAGFYEQTGIAQAKADKLNQILLDAVKGRYDGKMAPGTGGAFFSAITEAYPDLSGLNIYDKIVNYVQAKRQGYADLQTKLRDMLRDYDNWRNGGLFHPMWVSMAGFPSSNLQAQIGTTVTTGAAAETQMKNLVLVSQATNAYQTGTDSILTVPGQTPAPPTTTSTP